MKAILKNNITFILILVFQILMISCSKRIQPEVSSGKIENKSKNLNIKTPSDSLVTENKTNNKNIVTQHVKTEDFIKTVAERPLDTHKTNAQDIIGTARKYLGVPHCMGGTTRKCMDCSGLLLTVFAEYNIQLPHSAQDQAGYGIKINSINDLKEGDLIFFTNTYRTKKFITHSGIYIGDNNFIHTSSNTGVSITSLNQKYWKEKFVFGKRILQ